MAKQDGGPSEIPVAVWSGEFRILGVTLHCHVLDDGRRIIDEADVALLFETMADTEVVPEVRAEFEAFAKWMHGLGREQ